MIYTGSIFSVLQLRIQNRRQQNELKAESGKYLLNSDHYTWPWYFLLYGSSLIYTLKLDCSLYVISVLNYHFITVSSMSPLFFFYCRNKDFCPWQSWWKRRQHWHGKTLLTSVWLKVYEIEIRLTSLQGELPYWNIKYLHPIASMLGCSDILHSGSVFSGVFCMGKRGFWCR